jgi:hypothetical protein
MYNILNFPTNTMSGKYEGYDSANDYYSHFSEESPDVVVRDAERGVQEARTYLSSAVEVLLNSGAYSDEDKKWARRVRGY